MSGKKLLAVFLAMSLILILPLGAFAATGSSDVLDKAQKLVNASIRNPYNSYADGSYAIGAELPVYLARGGALTEFHGVRFFPVYCDGQLAGIVKINGADTDSPIYTFGRYFSGKLRELTQNGSLDVTLVAGETQLFAVVNGSATEVADYTVGEQSGTRLSANTVESRVASSRSALGTANGSVKTALNARAARGEGMASWLNVEEYNQGSSTTMCWAVSAWCIGKYIAGKPHASGNAQKLTQITAVAKSAGKDISKEGGPVDIVNALNKSYQITGLAETRPISDSIIMRMVDSDQPFSAMFYTTDEKKGHTVTGMGYDCFDPNDFIFWAMDSLSDDPDDCIVAMLKTGNRYYWQGTKYTYYWSRTVSPVPSRAQAER